ncbi:NAD-dependent epimerase/dehydratase family protein [Aquirufa sp. ROCK2-A2]
MEKSQIKVIITGATGMVGEGVLHECLLSPYIAEILVIGRKPCGVQDAKLKEIILTDFLQPASLTKQVKNYDACFFCLGVSSIGMNESDYTEKTHTLTLGFAEAILPGNPDLTFVYVSGVGTDRTESGRVMWARVKGRTENDLALLGFSRFYAFRPSLIFPTSGLKHALRFYQYINWMYPFLKKTIPSMVSTLAEVGKSMIFLGIEEFEKNVVDVNDIRDISRKYDQLVKE